MKAQIDKLCIIIRDDGYLAYNRHASAEYSKDGVVEWKMGSIDHNEKLPDKLSIEDKRSNKEN